MRQITIDGKVIDDFSDAYIIAEIGHNHCGRLDLALKLCDEAKRCGCDAVKLQKRSNKNLYMKALYNRSYNSEHAYGKTYGEHREALELDLNDWLSIKRHCAEIGITLFATAFDPESVDLLLDLGMPAFKVASGDIKNIPLLELFADMNKPVIISTGGANLEDIERADLILFDAPVAYLHCVALYPTPADRANLSAIMTLREEFPHRQIGYSCHFNGIIMAEAAYIYGARIIEKHFTLDHTMKGSDHALSLQPDGMRRMVRDIKRLRMAMGHGKKQVDEQEETALSKMAKSLYPTRDILAGTKITDMDVQIRSPAVTGGLEPYRLDEVIGKCLIKDVSTSLPYYEEDFEK